MHARNTVDFRLSEEDRILQARFGHDTCNLMLSHGAKAILQSLLDPFAFSFESTLSVNCLDLTPGALPPNSHAAKFVEAFVAQHNDRAA